MKFLSHVQRFVNPWTVAYQAPPIIGFSRQKYWSGLPFPSPEDFPKPAMNLGLLHWRQTLYHLRHQSYSSVQFSRSVVSDSLWFCPMNLSMPGFPVHHQLPEFTQTHVHQVGDAIQPFYPLSSPFPPVFNLSQHPGLFKWVSSSHQVAKVLAFQLQHQSSQWIFRTDVL